MQGTRRFCYGNPGQFTSPIQVCRVPSTIYLVVTVTWDSSLLSIQVCRVSSMYFLIITIMQDSSLPPAPPSAHAPARAPTRAAIYGSWNSDNSTCITSASSLMSIQDIAYVRYVNQRKFYYLSLWCFPLSFTSQQGSTVLGSYLISDGVLGLPSW